MGRILQDKDWEDKDAIDYKGSVYKL